MNILWAIAIHRRWVRQHEDGRLNDHNLWTRNTSFKNDWPNEFK